MTEPHAAAAVPTCPRHPDRESHLRCQRCGRPTCPECQHPAPVGFHCVDCLAESRRTAPRVRTPYGGEVAHGPPLVTYTLIGLCVLAYGAQLVNPAVSAGGSFVPALGRQEPWRFITSAFLHSPGNPLHLLFNMLCLWQLGQFIEPMLGRGRFLAVYLICGFGGSVGFLLFAFPPQSWADAQGSLWLAQALGASGAVFGLFGAALIMLRQTGRSAGGILVLLVINALFPLLYPAIAWQAHLGGFLTGLVLVGVLGAARERSRQRWQWPAVLAVAVVLVLVCVLKYAAVDTGFVDGALRLG